MPKPTLPPRRKLARAIEATSRRGAKRFARFLLDASPEGAVPCWGAIAERFEEDFADDTDRVAVLNALMEEGEFRSLLVFLHANADRPRVLEAMVLRASELPKTTQRALAVTPQARALLEQDIVHMPPAIQALVQAAPVIQERVREQQEQRVQKLLAIRRFVPDAFDPADEPR